MRHIRITRTRSTRRTKDTTDPVGPFPHRKKASGPHEADSPTLPGDLDLRSPSGRPLPY